MEVVIAPGPELGRLAAAAIEQLVREQPDAVLGLATGSSPLAVYDELARRHAEHGLSFARARAFMLDEYVGLAADHPERYRNVIEKEIASRVDFAPGAVQGPDGLADDLVGRVRRRTRTPSRPSGGVDLQLLGIGTDGHIAFNEPGSSLASRTRIKTLTAPDARGQRPVLRRRRRPGAAALPHAGPRRRSCPPGTWCCWPPAAARPRRCTSWSRGRSARCGPATILQHHPHVTVLVDDAAASRLQLADYYRETFAAKPDWQGL